MERAALCRLLMLPFAPFDGICSLAGVDAMEMRGCVAARREGEVRGVKTVGESGKTGMKIRP